MVLKKNIHNSLIKMIEAPPETGGILGSSCAGVIDSIIYDKSVKVSNIGIYEPNVSYLNSCIDQWQKIGVKFLGVFHSHPKYQTMLSSADIAFINKIMCAMPLGVDELFFPIIIPKTKVFAYKAVRRDEMIEILSDKVILKF